MFIDVNLILCYYSIIIAKKETPVMEKFDAPSVRELLDSGAEKYGDSTFIKFIRNDVVEERSFIKVRSDSLAVCRWIRSLSEKRMHVAIIGKSNYEYITCLSGILISGNVAVDLENEYGISVDSKAFGGLKTVGDLMNYINSVK